MLTVVIPHLNDGAALGRCLTALAAQRAETEDFEVIVVDNGSETMPDAVCAGFPFVRLEQELTPGPGPARSHGAHLSEADLLAFIDADCVAGHGWIAEIRDHFAANPETGIIGGSVRVTPAIAHDPTPVEAYEAVFGYRMQLYIERDHYTATCNMAVRRTVFEEVGDFLGLDVAEDMEWGRRAFAKGVRIDYVPEMRISTPARSDFEELTRKWDRHIGHDYAVVEGPRDTARWIVRSLLLAVSPLAEIPRIVRTDRLTTPRERWRSFRGTVRIRLYRARTMLRVVVGGDASKLSGAWNRR